MTGPRVVGVVAALVVAGLLVPAATATATPGTDEADITVGDQGPTISINLNTTLFTNLPGPGAVGVSIVGNAMNTTIARVEVAVVFQGVGNVGAFFSEPFSRFEARSEVMIQIPALTATTGDDYTYQGNSTINAS